MEGVVAALQAAAVTCLIDIRHSPCASVTDPAALYGPKPWNLQPMGGIVESLWAAGIDYRWMIELGNPQKNDRQMQILRWQLADGRGHWPVHRGLELLAVAIREAGQRCCLLCACANHGECHRKLIADEVRARQFGGKLAIRPIGKHGIAEG
jgi:hypothetical protein